MIKKISSITRAVVIGSVLMSCSDARCVIVDDVNNVFPAFVLKVVATAYLGMLEDSIALYHWTYNKLFPHVTNIRNGLLRINATLNVLDKQVGKLQEDITSDVHTVMTQLAQLPNKRDAATRVTALGQFLVQEQQRCASNTEITRAEVEARLIEELVRIEESLSDAIALCRHTVERGNQEATNNQIEAGKKLTDIVQDNAKILGALCGATIKQVMEQKKSKQGGLTS